MQSVCFTGKGMSGGILVTRDQWKAQAQAAGYHPVNKVGQYPGVDYLVASRHDTSKAIDARANGRTKVISYDEWQETLGTFVARGMTPAPWHVPKPTPVDNSANEAIDGWGSF